MEFAALVILVSANFILLIWLYTGLQGTRRDLKEQKAYRQLRIATALSVSIAVGGCLGLGWAVVMALRIVLFPLASNRGTDLLPELLRLAAFFVVLLPIAWLTRPQSVKLLEEKIHFEDEPSSAKKEVKSGDTSISSLRKIAEVS